MPWGRAIGAIWLPAAIGAKGTDVSATDTQKREAMHDHLEKSDSVYVKFDARRDGVVLPPHLKRDAGLVLQYGLNMRIPIPDLDIGEAGIGATLSFNRTPVWTFVPWSAVFAIVSESGARLWEADAPPDLPLGEAAARGARPSEPHASKPPKRPSLRAVEGGRRAEEPPAVEPGEKMASLIDELPSEPLVAPEIEPAPSPPPSAARAEDDIVDVPGPAKKKRELPPWLRVVK